MADLARLGFGQDDQTVPAKQAEQPGGWTDWLSPSAVADGFRSLNQRAHDAVSYAGNQYLSPVLNPLLGYAQTFGDWVIDHRATASAAVGCVGASMAFTPLECWNGARSGLGLMGEATSILDELAPKRAERLDLSDRAYISDQSVPLLIDVLRNNAGIS